eukprot:398779-Amphidinium_carterae.1
MVVKRWPLQSLEEDQSHYLGLFELFTCFCEIVSACDALTSGGLRACLRVMCDVCNPAAIKNLISSSFSLALAESFPDQCNPGHYANWRGSLMF